MNTIKKTHFIVASLAATALAGFASVVVPHSGEALAAIAIVAALIGMGTLESKERTY